MSRNSKLNIYFVVILILILIVSMEFVSRYLFNDTIDKSLNQDLLEIVKKDSDLANHIGENINSKYFNFHPNLTDTLSFDGVLWGTKGSIKFTGVLSKDNDKWVIYSLNSEKMSERCKFCD